MSGDDPGEGNYTHDSQHCGLTKGDFVGERDALSGGEGIRAVSTQRGRELKTYRYVATRQRST